MKLQEMLHLSFILIFLLFMTSCALKEDKPAEQPKGTIQLTVTFPTGDYQACVIPDGVDRLSIYINRIGYPPSDTEYVEVLGEPGETKTVQVEIEPGDYVVAVFATKKTRLPSGGGPYNNVIAAGMSDPVEVMINQVSQTTVMLEEVLWTDLSFPDKVKKGEAYTYSATVNRVFHEYNFINTYLEADAFDDEDNYIPGSALAAHITDITYLDNSIRITRDITIPDFEGTGTLRVVFRLGTEVFGYVQGDPGAGGVDHFIPPVMESEVVEDMTGIIIIIE